MADELRGNDFGETLIKREVLTREELDAAREVEKTSGLPLYRQLLQAGRIGFSMLEDSLRYEFHPRSRRIEHQNLGRALVEMKAISEADLEEALEEQERSGRLLGRILLERGLIDQHTMAVALARQHGMEFVPLEDAPSDAEVLSLVPESIALRNQFIPHKKERDVLIVLLADPQARNALKDTEVLLGFRIQAKLTSVNDMRQEIRSRYESSSIKSQNDNPVVQNLKPNDIHPSKSTETRHQKNEPDGNENRQVNPSPRVHLGDIAEQTSGMPVIRLVQTIIEGAINAGATDIHLDPQDPEMRVRYRIDGILHDVMSVNESIQSAVISRIKLMADIDITETRHPQDGHIQVQAGKKEYDIRVATLPTYLGERIVLRLLDQSSVLAGIKDLGLEAEDEKTLLRLIHQPYGMILVTGPTGSGKTTTLYAALNQKNVLEESIVTLEDPVEYQLSGINQVQIDPDIGVTFANTLRAALRQDIDVLLVGEIRDPETAKIAIRAAMTGHLVFSTMHTNDAPEAITILRNMGVPSYLLTSALTAVIAQRLVRTICPECKKAFRPNKALLQSLGLPETVKTLHRGMGCDACYHTGNRGRTGVFEILEVTPEVRRLISTEETPERFSEAANIKTIADRCRVKLRQGLISPEDFLRIHRT